MVLRFSDAEFDVVRRRAALAGLAVGAWIGQTAIDAAERGENVRLDLPDLLRLHADVVLFERAASERADLGEQVLRLLARLDSVVDVVVAAHGRSGR